MKKNQAMKQKMIRRAKVHYVKKPFDFCCDINRQDINTRYNIRRTPYKSSFPETLLHDGLPDVKVCIQDIAKSLVRRQPTEGEDTISEEDIDIEYKRSSVYGKSIKNRGAFKWFLEDEISVAQENLAAERKKKYREHVKDKKKKKKKRQKSKTNKNEK